MVEAMNPTKPSRSTPSLHRRRRAALKLKQRRRLFAEQLESRALLAALHNWDDPFDTDSNGIFTPADILHVINQINEQTGTSAATSGGEGEAAPVFYNDVNGDGLVSPIDALHTICLLYTSPSPRDGLLSRMPSSA